MTLDQNIKVAVDAIVFGYMNGGLYVLLIKQKFGALKDRWALVGGFVKDNEGLHAAVHRELEEEAGIKVRYLEQLYTFGDNIHRDPRFRVISVAYFALVNSSNIVPQADTDAEEAGWFLINDIPSLAFDHEEILHTALERLRSKVMYQPIGFDLLPDEFLFSDLENLYTAILGKEIDRRNFRKKILSYGFVEETNTIPLKTGGRPAKYFTFNKTKYEELLKKGLHFEL